MYFKKPCNQASQKRKLSFTLNWKQRQSSLTSSFACSILYMSQLMRTNYFNFQIVKTLKTIIFAPTCFGLHKPSSGSYGLRFAKVTVLIAIYKSLLKYSVLWLHISFSLQTEYFNNDLYLMFVGPCIIVITEE